MSKERTRWGRVRSFDINSKRLCFERPFKLYRWMNVRFTSDSYATSAQRPFYVRNKKGSSEYFRMNQKKNVVSVSTDLI